MAEILFLAHRIPYPPDKGDKIRSWNILRHLAERHVVHLGCFIDDPDDFAHVDRLRALCGDCRFISLAPRMARLMALRGLVTGEALSLTYYRHPALARWVDEIVARPGLGGIFLFSSPMAQYVPDTGTEMPIVMDFVDVDSDKWAQYARTKPWPLSALYRREARRLLDFERQVAARATCSLFVSPAEAALFRRLAPDSADRIGHLNNGVNGDYFSPDHDYPDPYDGAREVIVFTGAMDYWANVDAVVWFARSAWPDIRTARTQAQFWIVGARPAPQVEALAALDGVTVTGRVADVRPYLAHARVSVAPLRIARGVQNKVLEAMAMARPVVASPAAVEGIEAEPGHELTVAEAASDFAAAVIRYLEHEDAEIGARARARIAASYRWDENLRLLDRYFAGK